MKKLQKINIDMKLKKDVFNFGDGHIEVFPLDPLIIFELNNGNCDEVVKKYKEDNNIENVFINKIQPNKNKNFWICPSCKK